MSGKNYSWERERAAVEERERDVVRDSVPPRPAVEGDVVRLLNAVRDDDHKRGCEGRCYACSCGYDDEKDDVLEKAADRIAELEAKQRDFGEIFADIHKILGDDAPPMNFAHCISQRLGGEDKWYSKLERTIKTLSARITELEAENATLEEENQRLTEDDARRL